MTVEKNLIELVQVDDKELAIERQSENCWVNLTEMAKPFGKKTAHWLRLKETQDYLKALADEINNQSDKSHLAPDQVADSQLGIDDLIIVRYGGRKGEAGTWCTDYRIAMRFAQWLDARFSVKVDTLLVRIANGELIVNDSSLFRLGRAMGKLQRLLQGFRKVHALFLRIDRQLSPIFLQLERTVVHEPPAFRNEGNTGTV